MGLVAGTAGDGDVAFPTEFPLGMINSTGLFLGPTLTDICLVDEHVPVYFMISVF